MRIGRIYFWCLVYDRPPFRGLEKAMVNGQQGLVHSVKEEAAEDQRAEGGSCTRAISKLQRSDPSIASSQKQIPSSVGAAHPPHARSKQIQFVLRVFFALTLTPFRFAAPPGLGKRAPDRRGFDLLQGARLFAHLLRGGGIEGLYEFFSGGPLRGLWINYCLPPASTTKFRSNRRPTS